jgi:dihydrofolate reductase
MADRLYVTKIEKQYEGDTFFPSYGDEWQVVSQSEVNETEDGLKFTYLVYERK